MIHLIVPASQDSVTELVAYITCLCVEAGIWHALTLMPVLAARHSRRLSYAHAAQRALWLRPTNDAERTSQRVAGRTQFVGGTRPRWVPMVPAAPAPPLASRTLCPLRRQRAPTRAETAPSAAGAASRPRNLPLRCRSERGRQSRDGGRRAMRNGGGATNMARALVPVHTSRITAQWQNLKIRSERHLDRWQGSCRVNILQRGTAKQACYSQVRAPLSSAHHRTTEVPGALWCRRCYR